MVGKNVAKIVLLDANPVEYPPVPPYGLQIIRSHLPAEMQSTPIFNPFQNGKFSPSNLESFLTHFHPSLIGVGIRNLDDGIPVRQVKNLDLDSVLDIKFYLAQVKELTDFLKHRFPCIPIVAGGNAFSVCPEAVLSYLKLDLGVVGPGEQAFPRLVNKILAGERLESANLRDIPGLILWHNNQWIRQPNCLGFTLEPCQPLQRTEGAGNREGIPALIPVRTRHGCCGSCSYCLEPIISRQVIYRPSHTVVEEIVIAEQAFEMNSIFFADSELNFPDESHAIEILQNFIKAGLHQRFNWRGYFTVRPFSEELAALVAKSNNYAISLTVDSLSDAILIENGCPHRKEDVFRFLKLCQKYGIRIHLFLLFGLPGETAETIEETVKECDAIARHFGVKITFNVGSRIFPGTAIAHWARRTGYRHTYWYDYVDEEFLKPNVYCSPWEPKALLAALETQFTTYPHIGVMGQKIGARKRYKQEVAEEHARRETEQ